MVIFQRGFVAFALLFLLISCPPSASSRIGEETSDFFSEGAAFLEIEDEENLFLQVEEEGEGSSVKDASSSLTTTTTTGAFGAEDQQKNRIVQTTKTIGTAAGEGEGGSRRRDSSSRGGVSGSDYFSAQAVRLREEQLRAQVLAAKAAGANEAAKQAAIERLVEVSSTTADVSDEERDREDEEEEEEEGVDGCKLLKEAQDAVAEIQARVRESQSLLESAQAHLRSSRASAKQILLTQAETDAVLNEQAALVQALLASHSDEAAAVLSEELFAKLHQQAMTNSALGKRFASVLTLLQEQSVTITQQSLASSLSSLSSRIAMEREKNNVHAQRATDELSSATAVVQERQAAVDRDLMEEAFAEQKLTAARLGVRDVARCVIE